MGKVPNRYDQNKNQIFVNKYEQKQQKQQKSFQNRDHNQPLYAKS